MQTIKSSFRLAFENAQVKRNAVGTPLVTAIINSLQTKSGIKNAGRGWTANLSPRTTKNLVKEGIFG